MEVISNICSVLIIIAILAIPVLFIIFIIRWCMRKSKKWIGIATAICAGCIIPLTLIGTFTDPATYCEHEYSIVEEIAPTCTERGKVVKSCPLCERESTEYIDKVDHTWKTESVVSATCTEGGYKTERCAVCDDTKKTATEEALGHDMNEVSRKEATQDATGEIVYQCSRCDETETTVIKKLPKPTETTPPTETTEHVETTEQPTTKPTPTEPEVTFDKIYEAYERNELVADDLYKGNRYKVTGTIVTITNDGIYNLTGGAMLAMTVRVGDTQVYFYATFDKEQEEALKQVVVGDTITFEGTCSSAGSWYDCEIVR